jgi:hypothetical protein
MLQRAACHSSLVTPTRCLTLLLHNLHVLVACVQEMHGGQLLKISSQAEDDFVRLNLLWTGFFGETCKWRQCPVMCALHNHDSTVGQQA